MTLEALATALVLLTSSTADGRAAGQPVLARVGTRTITADEFRTVLVEHRKSGDQQRLARTLTGPGRKALLEQEVERVLLASAARERGLDQDPAVRAAVQRAVDGVLAEALLSREVDRLDLSDEALRRYFEEHSADFRTGPRVRARHILVRSAGEAEEARRAIEAGRDFGDLARAMNIDATRSSGGDLGWVSRGVMVKPFEDVLFALPAGGTSAVVETTFGFHVVRADDIDPGRLPSFDVARDRVKQAMVASRFRALEAALSAAYHIEIDEAALRGVVR